EAGEQLRHQPAGERGYRWLRQLAERVLRREVKRIRKGALRGLAGSPAAATERLPDLIADPRTPIPDELAESDGFQRAIARLLGRLPAGLREPFLLVVADGYDRD